MEYALIMNIFEIEKKILKAQSIHEIDSITKDLDNQTLRNIIKLLIDRLTPINIKINRVISALNENCVEQEES